MSSFSGLVRGCFSRSQSSRSNPRRNMRTVRVLTNACVETLELRTFMSVAPAPTLMPPVTPAPSPIVCGPMPQTTSTPAPVIPTKASVHIGIDNNGGIQIVAVCSSGQWIIPADIYMYMYHDNSRGAMLGISSGANYMTLPVNNISGITVNNATGGMLSFSAYDTALLGDNMPPIIINSTLGTGGYANVTSVVPLTVTADNVTIGDTGFYNARITALGNSVFSYPGGDTLVAEGYNAHLTSVGPISSSFFGNGLDTTMFDGAANSSTVYAYSGDTVSLNGTNGQVHVNAYSNVGGSTYTYVDVSGGGNSVDIHGDTSANVTVVSGNGTSVTQFTAIGHLNDYCWVGSGQSYLIRDTSLQFDSNFTTIGNVNVFYQPLNNDGGGDKG